MAADGASEGRRPVLEISGLRVLYGHVPALQGVDLTLDRGVLAVVGRNGMGKTTTCNAITGLVRAAAGSIKFRGREIANQAPNRIARLGIGYVPQGRRVWPSLSVDEHLRLASRGGPEAAWTVERVYQTFPRLFERRRNGGGQLSGGEQQMLAIGRALLGNPTLLVMDEPTEGLAPVIVEQVEVMLRDLADEGEISVLLIEQNIGVALDIAERVAVMVNGRVARFMTSAELAADTGLQQRLLGVGRHDDEPVGAAPPPEEESASVVYRVKRAGGEALPASPSGPAVTRWSQGNPLARSSPIAPARPTGEDKPAQRPAESEGPPPEMRTTIARLVEGAAYVVGTFDTKGRELTYLRNKLLQLGHRVVTVDLSTSGRPSTADIGPMEVARFHPRGANAVFTKDRGTSVAAMAEAFANYLPRQRNVAGIVSAGGSGGTSLATPAMQRLPVGTPKIMVSTVAAGDVKRYVGPTDITMMHSVTDVQGINSISEEVLSNAANALAGMVAYRKQRAANDTARKPAIGITMFGVTTPCVQMVSKALEDRYDCLVFHATGTGGQSMEKLAESGMLAGIIDVTTTEICDLMMGGVFSAGEERLDAVINTGLPYVGSCGALDMVNFGAIDTVPPHYRQRNLYKHNPQVTLMRTTAEENARMGRWIAEKLNRCIGPVRFLIPEGGVSLLDAPGQPFHDPEADRALFAALEETFKPAGNRRLVRLPYNLNDPEFARALVDAFGEVTAGTRSTRRGLSHAPI